MSDQEIQMLESQFPSISASAFAAARRHTLASGHSVLESSDGFIYEVFPNGQRKRVKAIDRPIPVTRGLKVRIR